MSKLTNIFCIGIGVAITKYYLDNPKKAKEHKNIIKKKIEDSINYSKCMCNYTQENGVSASIDYLKNDFKKFTNKNIKKLDNTLTCGKKILKDTNNIKEEAISLKNNASKLATNIIESKKIIKEDISPAINSYMSEAKKITNIINEKSEDLKKIINENKLNKKLKDYKKDVDSIIIETKDKINDFPKNNEVNVENASN